MKFTTKIKEYREKVRMKQSELAELVNVRRETIVCLENGKRIISNTNYNLLRS